MKNFSTCNKFSAMILYTYIISSQKKIWNMAVEFSNNTADWSVTINEKLLQSSQMSQHITVLHKDRTVWHCLCCLLFQFSWWALMSQRIFADAKRWSLSSVLRWWCSPILLRTSLPLCHLSTSQPLAKCNWLHKIALGSLLTAAFNPQIKLSLQGNGFTLCVASIWWLMVTSNLVLTVDHMSKLHHTSVK